MGFVASNDALKTKNEVVYISYRRFGDSHFCSLGFYTGWVNPNTAFLNNLMTPNKTQDTMILCGNGACDHERSSLCNTGACHDIYHDFLRYLTWINES